MRTSSENTGTTSFKFEAALHTYYQVGNVQEIQVIGLDKTEYFDKVDSGRKRIQKGDIVIAGETDRVYLNTHHSVTLDDPVLRRRCEVEKNNSSETVVWNPWAAKAKALADLADDEWRQMLCIETASVGASVVTLQPGEQHTIASVSGVSGH